MRVRTVLRKLNDGWNAEPNAPDPQVVVLGHDVHLSFLLNPYQFTIYVEGQRGVLRFADCDRYRLGPTNDEGWYRGQCRFSGIAPSWGEFYEVTGDLLLDRCPEDWKLVTQVPHGTVRHFLFYFRDETFECDAAGYAFEPLRLHDV